MGANGKVDTEVLATLEKFLAAYQKRDIESLKSAIAADDDLFMYGTGADEKRLGQADFISQVERDWAQMDELAFVFDYNRVSSAGSVAWVASEGLGRGKFNGHDIEFPLRMTSVFEKQGDSWLVRQAHVSVPAAGQEEGDSVPV
jgi:ketosteroid isomerase-like protein